MTLSDGEGNSPGALRKRELNNKENKDISMTLNRRALKYLCLTCPEIECIFPVVCPPNSTSRKRVKTHQAGTDTQTSTSPALELGVQPPTPLSIQEKHLGYSSRDGISREVVEVWFFKEL